ncbi:Alpha/Beta hydrolase protein [Dactylonectria macrodidyma]|uniref:Alpha/Beta hydrolase protein n=1 Tax=Dactylonectria macrodidyma TaxID=307937 RepID=A0A9P9FMT6_9HYPO|nr:Alpha/Beta hydrolase protein [Dactylonectria macrodidyma]
MKILKTLFTKWKGEHSWKGDSPETATGDVQQASLDNDVNSSFKSGPEVPFPAGVKVLHNCPNPTVDVCFVHGLSGNRDSTWTAKGQSAPWPKTLLPPKLSRARILTYGYDAYIRKSPVTSSNRLTDHATNLLNDLATDRASCDASSRPLLFVAHSLGGLVCKQAILLSRNNPESHLQYMFECTLGIIFLGTPHRGSWMANWAKIPASALGLATSVNKSLLDVLETNNEVLEFIQHNFWSMIRERQTAGDSPAVTCFFEELPLPVIGKVVSKDSATIEGYNLISIHANHRDMVKFGRDEDSGFKRVLGELVRWESQIEGPVVSQREPRIQKDTKKPSGTTHFGSGNIINGNVQNITNGSGNQFPGATFSGSVHFN